MEPNKDMQRNASVPPAVRPSVGGSGSYLGPGLRVKGEISGNEDLKLDSEVEGLISIGGFRLTLGPSAHMTGDIVAREAVISGEVNGDVRACDRIGITKSASVVGDLTTGKIMIEEGAYFKGNLEIDSNNPQIGTDLDSLLNSTKKTNEK